MRPKAGKVHLIKQNYFVCLYVGVLEMQGRTWVTATVKEPSHSWNAGLAICVGSYRSGRQWPFDVLPSSLADCRHRHLRAREVERGECGRERAMEGVGEGRGSGSGSDQWIENKQLVNSERFVLFFWFFFFLNRFVSLFMSSRLTSWPLVPLLHLGTIWLHLGLYSCWLIYWLNKPSVQEGEKKWMEWKLFTVSH